MGDSTRKLTVTSCEEITSGVGKKGPWTLYDVAAVDEAGDPVDQKLRAFDRLPVGELLEFEVTRQDHPKYGTSFTLTRPGIKSSGQRLGPKVDELREELEELKNRVRRLEERLESGATRAAAPATSDDDIPF